MKYATIVTLLLTITHPTNPGAKPETHEIKYLLHGRLRDETEAKLLGAPLRSGLQTDRNPNTSVTVGEIETVRYTPVEDGAARFTNDHLAALGPFLSEVVKVTGVKTVAKLDFEERSLYDFTKQFKL